MEFCDGAKVDNKAYLKQHNISVDEVCEMNSLVFISTSCQLAGCTEIRGVV